MRTEYSINLSLIFRIISISDDIIDAVAKLDPKRPAMIWCDESGKEIHFTYEDLMKKSNQTANILHGIQKGR